MFQALCFIVYLVGSGDTGEVFQETKSGRYYRLTEMFIDTLVFIHIFDFVAARLNTEQVFTEDPSFVKTHAFEIIRADMYDKLAREIMLKARN